MTSAEIRNTGFRYTLLSMLASSNTKHAANVLSIVRMRRNSSNESMTQVTDLRVFHRTLGVLYDRKFVH